MRNNSHLQKEKELASAVERWKTGEASNEELSLTAKTAKGELKITIKKRIKAFLLEEQKHRCAICKGLDTWNGKPLSFILDHRDGNALNHNRKNLRLICANCDSQLETHGSRNYGRGRRSSGLWRYERFKKALKGTPE